MAKMTLELSSEIDGKLDEIAKRSGITKAEAMHRAFALLVVADQEKQKGGGFSIGIVREDVNCKLEAVGKIVGV